MNYETQYLSPVGRLTLRSDGGAITGIAFGSTDKATTCPVIEEAERWLDAYFRGERPDARTLPLKGEGTGFQKSVWKILLTIPYGKTMTYGQIAKVLGPGMSARAVGQAVGRNPIAIVIPCHRVLGTGGKITGFSGGLDIKRELLHLEGIPYRDR